MTSGIIDGVRVSFTQSGGNFSLGSATDASVRSAVSIANGTTVYYVAVGIDANGAEIEREVGEGAISSTGTVITPASRSWSTSGVGVGHTFTAVTKVLTLGVTRAMLDALIATRQPLNANLTALAGLTGAADRAPVFTGAGAMALATLTARTPSDVWHEQDVGVYAVGTAPLPFVQAAVAGGTFLQEQGALSSNASAHWLARTNASNANSGMIVYYGSPAVDIHRLRGGHLMRTVIQPSTITAQTRRIVGFLNGAATVGAYFLFFGSDVVGQIDGSNATSTTFTLVVDTVYVLEVETNAAGTEVTFRVRNGLTDAVLWEETETYAVPTTALRFIPYSGIYATNPGGVTGIDRLFRMGVGTRTGFDVYRRGLVP